MKFVKITCPRCSHVHSFARPSPKHYVIVCSGCAAKLRVSKPKWYAPWRPTVEAKARATHL